MKQLMRFTGVGAVGFVTDGGLLWLLIANGFDAYSARFISFPTAVLVTWTLNRIWTFNAAEHARPAAQFSRYLSVQIISALINYVIYATTITLLGSDVKVALAGFTIGSAAGLISNFIGSKKYVFRA